MSPYIPLAGLMVLAIVFCAAAIPLSTIIGPARYNKSKYDSFECGIQATPAPASGGRFSVKYYVTAMLFIMFDIEIVFLYPWAVAFGHLDNLGVIAMIDFIITVFVAYYFVLRRGGLEWD
ncbi:NADH-quinone oxidoreductase subunit A [Propionibacterium sp. oral taxon 192 str. F0372]|uniref:NADH-quinone oxidoreductase subunit A n=1 Tax=Propionibacterium sp. oral taxon 192 TaxID=671222 RepID=UPI00035480D5|nr:NADH-quinone oxidoreductase subunit A [Propionibacterium sp. oral taxon 192]EPH07187.1 NADH-quinone oxidoreductase subunit A [Propionibacterium sp. oral taxon 192 str. F0372]